MGGVWSRCERVKSEGVSGTRGGPTVWLAVLQYAETAGKRLDHLQRAIVGGAAVPQSMIKEFRDKHGVEVRQGWGMTEMSPLGAVNSIKAGLDGLSDQQSLDLATRAGRGIFGVELRIVDGDGNELLRAGGA